MATSPAGKKKSVQGSETIIISGEKTTRPNKHGVDILQETGSVKSMFVILFNVIIHRTWVTIASCPEYLPNASPVEYPYPTFKSRT